MKQKESTSMGDDVVPQIDCVDYGTGDYSAVGGQTGTRNSFAPLEELSWCA